MARKALLIWCVGSALACGTAALATTSLWRARSRPSRLRTGNSLPDIAPPAPLTEIEAPVDAFVSLATVSFYEVTAGSSPFRGSFDSAPSIAATLAALPQDTFAEVESNDAPSDERLAVRPPPRPNFLIARLDATSNDTIGEIGQLRRAPGFETPSSPADIFGDAFRQLNETGTQERVINAGIASWYGPGFHGRKTASGERFDQNDLTAAHRTLPFGSRVKVVDERTGRSIVVRINDRGPFKHGRVIDLSKGAAEALGVVGLSRVKVVSAQ